MAYDVDDYHDLQREHHAAHQMISEMRDLLEQLHDAWAQNDDERLFTLVDGDVYEMLRRFEPDERDG